MLTGIFFVWNGSGAGDVLILNLFKKELIEKIVLILTEKTAVSEQDLLTDLLELLKEMDISASFTIE